MWEAQVPLTGLVIQKRIHTHPVRTNDISGCVLSRVSLSWTWCYAFKQEKENRYKQDSKNYLLDLPIHFLCVSQVASFFSAVSCHKTSKCKLLQWPGSLRQVSGSISVPQCNTSSCSFLYWCHVLHQQRANSLNCHIKFSASWKGITFLSSYNC